MIYNKDNKIIKRVIELYSQSIIMRNIPKYIKREFIGESKITYHDVRNILKSNDIPVRKENYRLSQNRIIFNEDYFSLDNHNSFYFAGFLLGDGYFQKKRKNLISLGLQTKDIQILNTFKKELGLKKQLLKKKQREAHVLNFTSYKIREDLNNKFFDIFNKSVNPNVKTRIFKSEYFFDFLRGLLDSDGNITITKNNYTYIRFALEYRLAFVIHLFLKKKYNIDSKLYFINKAYNLYELRYTGKNSYNLLPLIYHKDGFFLKRKFEKVLNTKNCPIDKKLEELLESPKAL